jgi:hypothetical protein
MSGISYFIEYYLPILMGVGLMLWALVRRKLDRDSRFLSGALGLLLVYFSVRHLLRTK